MKKKVMIALIVIVYGALLCTIIYYMRDNKMRKERLLEKATTLEANLKVYYENKLDPENSLGKLFVFPGETDIEFDESNLVSGEAFIYTDGKIEIALYDGKFCASKPREGELKIQRQSISSCIVNQK